MTWRGVAWHDVELWESAALATCEFLLHVVRLWASVGEQEEDSGDGVVCVCVCVRT
jgi:hypothetical protein